MAKAIVSRKTNFFIVHFVGNDKMGLYAIKRSNYDLILIDDTKVWAPARANEDINFSILDQKKLINFAKIYLSIV